MRSLFVLLLLMVVLSGCDSSSPAQVQTVEWYKEHEAECESTIKRCKNNPGELSSSATCVNAKRARDEIENANRDWIKPEPIHFNQ